MIPHQRQLLSLEIRRSGVNLRTPMMETKLLQRRTQRAPGEGRRKAEKAQAKLRMTSQIRGLALEGAEWVRKMRRLWQINYPHQ
jgi:hypothetical protein